MQYTDNTSCTSGTVCGSVEKTAFSLRNFLCNFSTSDIDMNQNINVNWHTESLPKFCRFFLKNPV